jgi:hypothetical protein
MVGSNRQFFSRESLLKIATILDADGMRRQRWGTTYPVPFWINYSEIQNSAIALRRYSEAVCKTKGKWRVVPKLNHDLISTQLIEQ